MRLMWLTCCVLLLSLLLLPLLSLLLQFLDHVSTTADRDTLSSSQIANLQQQLETSRAAAQL